MKGYKIKIIEIKKETRETYSVKCEIPEGYTWQAGQFGIWKFLDYKPSRVFSIASSPKDGYLMFVTRIQEEHSEWKEVLLGKKVGDYMMIYPPQGRFNIEKKRSLGIAGGVGIAPIRALAVENPDTKLTIFYSDSYREYCYKEEFDNMEGVEMKYLGHRNELYEAIEEYAKKYKNESEYLIVGSPAMNNGVAKALREIGVEKENIKSDMKVNYK